MSIKTRLAKLESLHAIDSFAVILAQDGDDVEALAKDAMERLTSNGVLLVLIGVGQDNSTE